MNELEELMNEAYDNDRIYKNKTKKWHDQKIMRIEFKAGELVLLLLNSCLSPSKRSTQNKTKIENDMN